MLSLEGSSIEFVLTRHEQGVAFMAERYGRLTRSPAVCLATLGPDTSNLITGVGESSCCCRATPELSWRCRL
jgi:acetolactate synthase-1/2/3 large subunit